MIEKSSIFIPCFDLYLSFTGGHTLEKLEKEFQSPEARALYCSVDTDLYYPEKQPYLWDLGYLGTYTTATTANPRWIS